jgi:TetR/AcrR family transcriptional regulator, lmrAB and yxaGH operons repressor
MPKEEILVKLLDVFRQYGYEGTSLAQIAQITGLGKASLYHYFPGGKEEMAEAALNYIDNWLEFNLLVPLRGNATPTERLQMMCERVEIFYDRGNKPCLWAILTLEQSSERIRTRIKSALLGWIDTLSEVVQDAGFAPKESKQRAQDAIARIQGSLILARGLNDTTIFARTMQELVKELLHEDR